MRPTLPILLALLPAFPAAATAETVLGAYIFSRHGDRTSKSTSPTNLTTLGYSQIFASGTSFRSRYISSSATSPISGISLNLINYAQISASAPLDTVLMPSAQGFLQGLYPPVGAQLGSQRLRNESTVQAPLDGYQLVPIETVATGNAASEDSAWLQGAGNCAEAITSSNAYFSTMEYDDLVRETDGFYKELYPVVNKTFGEDYLSYKNAYAIYDLINVATIHNASLPTSLLPPSTLTRLASLASTHELALAYNATDPIRAIAGATLAAQILQSLNKTLTSSSGTKAPKLTIQFGAYGSFLSFFGLANLTDLSGSIPDYASAMAFELVTNATVPASDLKAEDVSVRFLYRDGPPQAQNELRPYPLFAQEQTVVSWGDFAEKMGGIAVGDQEGWCRACGNSTGVCAAKDAGGAAGDGAAGGDGESSGGRGMSRAVAGVIGALVALAVVLGAEAVVMLVAGLRVVSRKKVGASTGAGAGSGAGMEKSAAA